MISNEIRRKVIIALDFDGTFAYNEECPSLGKPIPEALPYLKQCVTLGCEIILWTCRGIPEGLSQAANLVEKTLEIILYGVNSHPEDTHLPKVNANIFIDDKGVATPVKIDNNGHPYTDWDIVGPMLLQKVVDLRSNYGN